MHACGACLTVENLDQEHVKQMCMGIASCKAAHVLSFTEDEFIRVLELGDKLGE